MSAAADTVVACCQLGPRFGELERNRAASCAAITAAADAGAGVVVLPELAVSGYVFADAQEALGLAEPVDGPSVAAWAALARERDLVVVGGLCERDGDVLRNSAVLIDAGGLRAVYRKAHLWDREDRVFAPGSEAPPVIETAVGRIGIMVCYDLEFPEWVRMPALEGADLLCAPVNWPAGPRPAGERPAEVVRAQAAAATNRMFIAACDRAGAERGVDWVGGSVIVDPDGFPLAGPAGADEVATLVARCRLGDARDKRLGERNDALADRRPELYGPLTATATTTTTTGTNA
jgi:predicted amidohydrolase